MTLGGGYRECIPQSMRMGCTRVGGSNATLDTVRRHWSTAEASTSFTVGFHEPWPSLLLGLTVPALAGAHQPCDSQSARHEPCLCACWARVR